ncbi:uncharacterized protein BDZ99DRAFT_410308 [Mytilinidion resinicola]|uniref:Fungal-specific transcription factor domain-containing protein n=1 Tax=Mytilinidion resinicola TaxID=574789 RepID=A0A6A6Z170_9PEZI|nr:uncharacterized protein BDZ99DRAFT_410308 [Mytilinidion resinicola]KAF2814024.1 hypothetical protein BDZ99DRAFT_410308 [Mytilinidion resinicola]
MDVDRKLNKALEAANDAMQHLSVSPDFSNLDYAHIDRLLARVVDLPTEANQRNTRRNLLVVRQWMVQKGAAVILLEVLGQLFWRLGELNGRQFERFKAALENQSSYLSLVQDQRAVAIVVQRIRHIQKSKSDACQDFLIELSDGRSPTPMRHMSSPGKAAICMTSPEPEPAAFGTGLIKFLPSSSSTLWKNDMEHLLIEFYINGICPGRTPTKTSNAYITLLRTADTCPSTRFALLSLSASYIEDYVHAEKERYHQAHLFYMTEALQSLARQITAGDSFDACLATSMLLLHHDAVNNVEESNMCWSVHASIFDTIPPNQISPLCDAASFIRYQLILARTSKTGAQLRNTKLHSLETAEWYDLIPQNETQCINGVLGLSPQLLFLISSITALSADNSSSIMAHRHSYAQMQDSQLQNLRQWTTEVSGAALEIVLTTAETYRLATQIYLRCRLYGYTRFHPAVTELSDALISLILSIPVTGPLYTAIYPIWPLFIACLTCNAETRDRLYQRVVPIREGDKSTLPAVLRRISGLRSWLARQSPEIHRHEGWWDEMLEPESSAHVIHTDRLLCLG